MTNKIGNTEIEIIQGDITMLDVETIVNPANNQLMHLGGLALLISKRGGQIIQQESKKIGHVPTGSAVITSGGSLKAKHVIHAVGPRYKDGKSGEAEKLASAVKSALDIASKKKLKSVAMHAISCGIFGYPVNDAAKIILKSIAEYLEQLKKDKIDSTLEKIIVCLYEEETYKALTNESKNIFKETK